MVSVPEHFPNRKLIGQLPHLLFPLCFLQEVFHGVDSLLEALSFIYLDHLLFVGMVGLQLFNFDPGTGQAQEKTKKKKAALRNLTEKETQGQSKRAKNVLVFSSEEFDKMAFFAPGLFQVLGRAHDLKKKTNKNKQQKRNPTSAWVLLYVLSNWSTSSLPFLAMVGNDQVSPWDKKKKKKKKIKFTSQVPFWFRAKWQKYPVNFTVSCNGLNWIPPVTLTWAVTLFAARAWQQTLQNSSYYRPQYVHNPEFQKSSAVEGYLLYIQLFNCSYHVYGLYSKEPSMQTRQLSHCQLVWRRPLLAQTAERLEKLQKMVELMRNQLNAL